MNYKYLFIFSLIICLSVILYVNFNEKSSKISSFKGNLTFVIPDTLPILNKNYQNFNVKEGNIEYYIIVMYSKNCQPCLQSLEKWQKLIENESFRMKFQVLIFTAGEDNWYFRNFVNNMKVFDFPIYNDPANLIAKMNHFPELVYPGHFVITNSNFKGLFKGSAYNDQEFRSLKKFLLFLVIVSCDSDNAFSELNSRPRFKGMKVILPETIKCINYRNNSISSSNRHVKVITVLYGDCSTCYYVLEKMNDYYNRNDILRKVDFLVIITSPLDYMFSENIYNKKEFKFPIYLDLNNSFVTSNGIDEIRNFYTIILNKYNTLIYIGSPGHDKKYQDSFFKCLKNELNVE